MRQGEESSYTGQGGVSQARSADLSAAEEWTRGELVYRGRPLGEIVQDVERYSGLQITVDPQSAELEYSGTIVQSHIDDWLRRLPEIFPVRVVSQDAEHVHIRHR